MKRYNICLLILSLSAAVAKAQTPVLSLKDAIQIAIQNNYDVAIAKNDVEITKINNAWANTALLPTVSANGGNSTASNNLRQELSNGTVIERDNASSKNLNAGVAVSWQFFDGMRMFATKKRLEELQKIGETNFVKMVNTTAYSVVTQYYTIVQLQQQLKASKEVVALYEERLKIADNRFKIGTAAKTDLLQAQSDLNEQIANQKQLLNSIEVAKTNLNTIMARNATVAFAVNDTLNIKKDIDFAALQQKISKQNPDIQLANSNLIVLMQNKKEIQAQRLPTASLNGNYNFSRTKNAAGFNLLNQTYGPSVGVGVAIPIYNGSRIKKQIQVADLNIKNQNIAIAQIKNDIDNTLSNAYLNYKNGLELAELEQNNLSIVKENNTINLERFKKLSITSIELRQGQVDYINSQTRLINALYQAKLAEAEMLLLSGEIAD